MSRRIQFFLPLLEDAHRHGWSCDFVTPMQRTRKRVTDPHDPYVNHWVVVKDNQYGGRCREKKERYLQYRHQADEVVGDMARLELGESVADKKRGLGLSRAVSWTTSVNQRIDDNETRKRTFQTSIAYFDSYLHATEKWQDSTAADYLRISGTPAHEQKEVSEEELEARLANPNISLRCCDEPHIKTIFCGKYKLRADELSNKVFHTTELLQMILLRLETKKDLIRALRTCSAFINCYRTSQKLRLLTNERTDDTWYLKVWHEYLNAPDTKSAVRAAVLKRVRLPTKENVKVNDALVISFRGGVSRSGKRLWMKDGRLRPIAGVQSGLLRADGYGVELRLRLTDDAEIQWANTAHQSWTRFNLFNITMPIKITVSRYVVCTNEAWGRPSKSATYWVTATMWPRGGHIGAYMASALSIHAGLGKLQFGARAAWLGKLRFHNIKRIDPRARRTPYDIAWEGEVIPDEIDDWVTPELLECMDPTRACAFRVRAFRYKQY